MYKIENDRFIVEDYNWKEPFSDFFHGIAGKFGIPIWCYYVSRNQAVTSFGVRDKDHPMVEFLSFNRALEFVELQGFRTFLKIKDRVYEPFRKTENKEIRQRLIQSCHELELIESNRELGLKFKVRYFPMVKENFPAIIRELEIVNENRESIEIIIVDGLPRYLPYGIDLHCINTIARHIEGMIHVVFIDGIPVYRLKQTPQDIEKVGEIEGGNFLISLEGSGVIKDSYIVDPYVIFDEDSIYSYPWRLKGYTKESIEGILASQIKRNKTPSAFVIKVLELKDRYSLYSIFGFAKKDSLIREIIKKVSLDFIKEKERENYTLIESIKNISLTVSNDPLFDNYSKHTFLDNVIRGGMPIVFNTAKSKTAFYLYSRQNGDMERDYHYFILEPTYYSQGTGHYRSVNQNRRCDTWFFPKVEDRNIVLFMNLIQLDGYNPLEVNQLTYSVVKKGELEGWLKERFKREETQKVLKDYISKDRITPGEFIMLVEELEGDKAPEEYERLIEELLSFCEENDCGDIHEGFWIDHWFYNLDLIENYLMIYPERIKKLLLNTKEYFFYDNPDIVLPRSKKYVEVEKGKIRQYRAVYRSPEKIKMINSREKYKKRVRTEFGKGEIYYTNLFVKLLVVLVNRMAGFDPFGVGIEMEADKPGWNDSMNGLPGLLGSSLCETFELERMLYMMKDWCKRLKGERFLIFEELYEFMKELDLALEEYLNSNLEEKEYLYWDRSHTIKENYRRKTIFGISGKEKEITIEEVERFLECCLKFVSKIYSEKREKVFNKDGIPYTYIVNEVVEYKKGEDGRIIPLRFIQKPLPLFLEGPVHYLKVHPEDAEKIYNAVRNSALFDKKLKMYKVCESLDSAPFEIGRVKAWGSGWIENESIYTHMEYKYLLEILKSGLFEQFFKDIDTMLMPYIPLELYRRSPFENVSFIVSSAFSDERLHGRGLQPRLSGVTSEFINIWILMIAWKNPFFLDDKGELCFKVEPKIPSRFFIREEKEIKFIDIDERERSLTLPKNSFAGRVMNGTILIYINRSLKDTYKGVSVERYLLRYRDGRKEEIEGEFVPMPYSLDIREGKVDIIEAYLR